MKVTRSIQPPRFEPGGSAEMSMKIRKSIVKTTALALAVLVAIAGYAHAVSMNDCKGECCQNKRGRLQSERSRLNCSPHHAPEFMPSSPLCDPLHRYDDVAAKVFEKQDGHDENLPPCCKLAQGNEKIEGLTSRWMVGTDRSSNAGPAPIAAGSTLSDLPAWTVPARYFLPTRAAPIPPYLKNSVFLC